MDLGSLKSLHASRWLTALLFASAACSKAEPPASTKTVSVKWHLEATGSRGVEELTVFDGHVAEFLGRRMRVVDGTLRWDSQSFGPVHPGDKVRFTDEGVSVHGGLREPLGIEVELTSKNVTTTVRPMESGPSSKGPNRMGDIEWFLIDETLPVGNRAFAPVEPGDRIKITERGVSINGNPATPLH